MGVRVYGCMGAWVYWCMGMEEAFLSPTLPHSHTSPAGGCLPSQQLFDSYKISTVFSLIRQEDP
jgi:hypothetical protein